MCVNKIVYMDLRIPAAISQGETRIEALCTLCEIEGRPYVPAEYEYVVVSTLDGAESLVSVCGGHANQLDNGRLSYNVVSRKKGFDWTTK
jgi:hypothetical protein